jgi:tetratricopeptide (TPR) repeat protein
LKKKSKKRTRKRYLQQSGSSPKPARLRLSLCMIVKNEEEELPLCVNCVKAVLDEIIIVDTGSTDNTKEIARQLGARVFDFPWIEDFSAARNESVRRATGDYILWLDADDRVDPPEVEKLNLLKQNFPWKKNKVYYLKVNSQSPVDGETHFYHLRVFPNVAGARFEGRVHEQVFYRLKKLGMEFVQTDIILRHTGYHDEATIRQKSERNLKIIEDELRQSPHNLVHLYNGARTLSGIGRVAEAIEYMEKIVGNETIREKERQFFLEASILTGKYYADLGRYDRSAAIFQDLARQFPENGLVYFGLGESLFKLKDYKAAIEALQQSISFPIEINMFPVNLGKLRYYQLHILGECYMKTGQEELAREMLSRSLNLHRDHYTSLQTLGVLALQRGEFRQAADYFERAIKGGGELSSNYANLGLALRKLGRRGEAEKALLRSLELDPQKVEALVNLGQLHKEKKSHEKALEYFKKALDQNHRMIDVRLVLSDIYFRLQELEELVGQCDFLLGELNLPNNFILNDFKDLGELYTLIGDALGKQGRKELSLLAFQVSFLIFPSRQALEKMVPLATSIGILTRCLEEVAEGLRLHGHDVAIFEGLANHLSPV